MNKNKAKKKIKLLNIISIALIAIFFVCFSIFSYYLFKADIVPTKYLIIGYGLCAVIILILILAICMLGNKGKMIALVFTSIFAFLFGYASTYLKNTYKFLSNTQVADYETAKYSVVVLKDSEYKKIENLKNKTIYYLDNEYKEDIKKELENKIKYTEKITQEFGVLPDELNKKTVDAICLEEGYLNLIYDEVDGFKENTKVIYTFELKVKSHKEENEKIDVTTDPFILYISGIDQYGDINTVYGRSDVNIIAIVNPKAHHILLVNTPRDYYVQLAGTNGLKDKLTHAGIYGIEKSIQTLENFYGIDINYYLRVNFNTLISVVDVIGGIDVYSDLDFRTSVNSGIHVKEGWNHFNGKQALAYARERKSYLEGDVHRGQNQQQVISAIIDKVTQSKVLISKYNTILNTLNGTFQMDAPMQMLTSLIKYQIAEMPKWKVESIGVTGFDSSNYTYSMGYNWLLYVMEPDYDTVNTAKSRIQEVLNES